MLEMDAHWHIQIVTMFHPEGMEGTMWSVKLDLFYEI